MYCNDVLYACVCVAIVVVCVLRCVSLQVGQRLSTLQPKKPYLFRRWWILFIFDASADSDSDSNCLQSNSSCDLVAIIRQDKFMLNQEVLGLDVAYVSGCIAVSATGGFIQAGVN